MQQELRDIDEMIDEGDLTGAQIACKSLLQQHPTSAAAHEKMGDIMYGRELWEDAVEWYDLALQLNETPGLRSKLAKAQQRVREARTGPEPEPVEDTGHTRRLVWLGVGAAAMTLVVIMVVIGIAQSRRGRQDRPRSDVISDTGPGDMGSPALTSPSTVRSTRTSPAAVGDRPLEIPRAHENPQEHWAARQVPRRAPRRAITSRTRQEAITDPLTDHDRAVIDAVSSLTWDDERPMTGRVSAMVDPFTGYAVVRVTIPSSLPIVGLVERVVLQAYRVAVATMQADEVVSSITVQMVRVTDRGERVLAFRGNTTRETLRNLDTASPGFDLLWNNVFKTVWWNPQAGGAPPAAPEGEQAAATTG